MKKDAAQGASTTAQAAAQPAQAQESSVPLNAANLQQQQQQLDKAAQVSSNRNSQVPAAPTSAQAPFSFAPSPHGAGLPMYNQKPPAVTQESLQLPARKKQKQNNTPGAGQDTPGSTASPLLTKAISPEARRPHGSHNKPGRATLVCPQINCDRHSAAAGFDKEEDRKRHIEEEHVKPLQDPLKFVEENLRSTMNLDAQGRPKTTLAPASDAATAPSPAVMIKAGSKQGQTPNLKAASTPSGSAATPMMRQASMNRQSSSMGKNVSQANSKPQAVPKDSPVQNQKPVENRQGVATAQEVPAVDPWANTINPVDLFQQFSEFDSGTGLAISDMNVYRSITPNDTPESSKDGISEPNSDISDGVNLDINLDIFDDSWPAFGVSDAEAMGSMNMNMNMDMNMDDFVVTGEDLSMFEEEKPSFMMRSWDDVDVGAFDQPFVMDTSLFSFDAN